METLTAAQRTLAALELIREALEKLAGLVLPRPPRPAVVVASRPDRRQALADRRRTPSSGVYRPTKW